MATEEDIGVSTHYHAESSRVNEMMKVPKYFIEFQHLVTKQFENLEKKIDILQLKLRKDKLKKKLKKKIGT